MCDEILAFNWPAAKEDATIKHTVETRGQQAVQSALSARPNTEGGLGVTAGGGPHHSALQHRQLHGPVKANTRHEVSVQRLSTLMPTRSQAS